MPELKNTKKNLKMYRLFVIEYRDALLSKKNYTLLASSDPVGFYPALFSFHPFFIFCNKLFCFRYRSFYVTPKDKNRCYQQQFYDHNKY